MAAPLPPQLLFDTATLFGLLSAPARVHIVWLLTSGEQDVGTLAEATGHTVATVSHHLGKLRLAGIVRAQRVGRRQVYLVQDIRAVELAHLAIERRLGEGVRDNQRYAMRDSGNTGECG